MSASAADVSLFPWRDPRWWVTENSTSTHDFPSHWDGTQIPDDAIVIEVIAEKPVKAEPKPPSRWVEKQIKRRGWK